MRLPLKGDVIEMLKGAGPLNAWPIKFILKLESFHSARVNGRIVPVL